MFNYVFYNLHINLNDYIFIQNQSIHATMIPKILSISRNTEVNAVAMQILAAYHSSSLSTDTNLSDMIVGLEQLTEKMSKAIYRIKKDSDLKNKDKLRDNAVRALYYLIQGNAHHPDTEIKGAALKIMSIFNHYGLKILSESYCSESS